MSYGNKNKRSKVAILVTNGFEQSELAEPKKALEQAGAIKKIKGSLAKLPLKFLIIIFYAI